jgi:hypothetical protein
MLEYIKVKVPFRILLRLECSSFRFLKELKLLERDSPARLKPRERYEWIDRGQYRYMTPYVSSNFLEGIKISSYSLIAKTTLKYKFCWNWPALCDAGRILSPILSLCWLAQYDIILKK